MRWWIWGLVALLAGCTAKGDTPEEKRGYVQGMREQVLTELYQEKASIRDEVQQAKGYAVFSSVNNSLVFVSAGSGFGVVRDNQSGKDIYMSMANAGVGLGLGIKDFRALILFNDAEALKHFIEVGWEAGAQADAAARSGDKGSELLNTTGSTNAKKVTVYQLTQSGLVLQATLQGYKYWADDELNEPGPATVQAVQ
ncbi:lipid-binding SYLF domain-containing protein [Aeromonas aquatica]|uniref:lipid-binding SYLF domain-containing protein n=1 Tax=Aeromonas aquatica TaxID=558964 RepID=UPI00286F128B|nr:hypothetical protein [Aeromonas aquatica]